MIDLAAWAEQAAAGDGTAASALIRATQSDVWRWHAAMVDRDAADDLVQETFLRALKALPTFAGRSDFRTWLFTIARRVAADELRARGRRRRLAQALADNVPAQRFSEADSADSVAAWQLLAGLEPDQRAAVLLTQVFEMTYAEAAIICGCRVGTIKSRVARARTVLEEAWCEPAPGQPEVSRS